MTCYTPLKGWKDSETNGITFKRPKDNKNTMEVACGQCIGCRLDRATMWMARICHEASLHNDRGGNSFVTLTYNDENIPDNWSLDKSHFTKFMKRLRKKHTGKKIRYFQCGEYGNICKHGLPTEYDNPYRCPHCNVGRPHHHAILFNHTYNDLIETGGSKDHKYYTSEELTNTWKYGITQVGTVTPQSAGYVARYCIKKVNGSRQDEHYQSIEPKTGEITYLHPEYATMSRRPGIGKEWYDKYATDVFPSDETPVPGRGVIPTVPRYYTEILKSQNPDLHEQIKQRRLKHKEDYPEEYTGQRLIDKSIVKQAQIKSLKRELA